MVPVCVQRQWKKRKPAAVTWWVDDVFMDESERCKKKISPPDRRGWARQMSAVAVFDALIFNTDRHRNNLLISKDWKVWLIDHTRAFRRNVTLPRKKALRKVDRRLLQKLSEISDDQLRGSLGPLLKEVEIRALLVRRDRIIQHFQERIREVGEEAVFY
jgi:hypothetical protein